MSMLINSYGFASGGGGSDPSLQPHRYWRVRVFSNSSNVIALTRLEMRETEGGADVATGGTLISYGTGGWTSASNLFDGSDSTFGYCNNPTYRNYGIAVGRDFGATSGNWKTIRQILFRNRQDGNHDQAPLNFRVEYSDDASTWTGSWEECFSLWTSTGQSRTSSKSANPSGSTTLRFNVVTPPTDSGPYSIPLTAVGNATTSGGRFVLDGTGDWYSAASASRAVCMAWQSTIEIDDIITNGGTGLKTILNLGLISNRLLVVAIGTDLAIYASSNLKITATNYFTLGVAKSLKIELNGNTLTAYNPSNVSVGTANLDDMIVGNTFLLGVQDGDTSRCLNGGFAGVRIRDGLVV